MARQRGGLAAAGRRQRGATRLEAPRPNAAETTCEPGVERLPK
jgi:hypothetical protein